MSDTNGNDDTRSMAPVVGFVLGAVVGAGLALLFAPASGKQTRQQLGSTARRMSREARHALREARATMGETASSLGADVKSAMEAGRAAFRHDGGPAETRPRA